MTRCDKAPQRTFKITRDLLDDRNGWKFAFDKCESKFDTLVNWIEAD